MNETTDVVKKEAVTPMHRHQAPVLAPLVDIYENDDELLLHADMPGVEKENISVNVDNGKLSVVGMRRMERSGSMQWEEFGNVEYRRTFSVPQTIDVAKVNAVLKDGVLRLHLPKSEAAKPRQIEIKAE